MKTLAVIPARGGSKGLKRKNLRKLNGKPLIHHTIQAALNSKRITDIIVSSEDQEIINYASQYVDVQKRANEHATDSAGVDKLLQYVVERYETEVKAIDVVVLLYPTSPLRTSSIIDDSIEKFSKGGYDSLLTLHEDDKYLWRLNDDTPIPINYNPQNRAPRQLEGWNQYAENKMLYVMKKDLLVSTGCRLGGKIGYFLIDPLLAVDIDDSRDLRLAELIMQNLTNRQK